MGSGQIEGQAAAVGVAHRVNLVDLQRVEQRHQQFDLATAAVGSQLDRPIGETEAVEVGGDHPVAAGQLRDHLAPAIGGSAEAVDEQNRLSAPCGHRVHPPAPELEEAGAGKLQVPSGRPHGNAAEGGQEGGRREQALQPGAHRGSLAGRRAKLPSGRPETAALRLRIIPVMGGNGNRGGRLWVLLSLVALLALAGCNGAAPGDANSLCGNGYADGLTGVRNSGAVKSAQPVEVPPSEAVGGGGSPAPARDLESNPLGIFGPIFPGLGPDSYTVACEVYDDGYGNCL